MAVRFRPPLLLRSLVIRVARSVAGAAAATLRRRSSGSVTFRDQAREQRRLTALRMAPDGITVAIADVRKRAGCANGIDHSARFAVADKIRVGSRRSEAWIVRRGNGVAAVEQLSASGDLLKYKNRKRRRASWRQCRWSDVPRPRSDVLLPERGRSTMMTPETAIGRPFGWSSDTARDTEAPSGAPNIGSCRMRVPGAPSNFLFGRLIECRLCSGLLAGEKENLAGCQKAARDTERPARSPTITFMLSLLMVGPSRGNHMP